MAGVFTTFVRALPAPSDAEFDAAWRALAAALRGELRRRGLWTAPPSYLGVIGWDRWDAIGFGTVPGNGGRARRGPLDELVADCFSYNFVERLRSLLAQLRTKPDIDGLVRLNVRHFVYERQRRYDPVGFRVFEVVREAIEEGLRRGVLRTESDDRRIANATVIALAGGPFSAPVPVPVPVPIADRETVAAAVRRWNDHLLPDLLVVVGRRRQGLIEQLVGRLEALAGEGIARFRFKDLIDPLKHDARARWGTFLAQWHGPAGVLDAGPDGAAGARASPGGVSEPDLSLEERQHFEWLASEVAASIERIDTDPRRRAYLARLWRYFAPTGSAGSDPDPVPEGGRLSNRRLGELLGIPRERLPELMSTLGELLTRVRAQPPTAASLQEP